MTGRWLTILNVRPSDMIEHPFPKLYRLRIGGVRRLFAILALGVAACSPWTMRPCLKSDSARTRFVRERWGEATDPNGAWKTRICATEDVITYSHYEDDYDWTSPPACKEEIVNRLETELFRHSPVANNRLQLARINAISLTAATHKLKPEQADILLRLAALRPEDIADYELTPGERGPPLGKEIFRRLALRALTNSHVEVNENVVWAAVLARRRHPSDAIERRLLEADTAYRFEEARSRRPSVAAINDSFALFDQILAETTAALDRDYEEVEHGLILDHLQLMALYAKHFGRELPASRLFRTIVDREARVASVRGKPAARRDLYVAARMAEAECHQVYKFSESWRWYEEAPRTLDELVFEPALYKRGFECPEQTSKTSTWVQLSEYLERFAQGTLSPRDGVNLLQLLPEQPEQVTARADVRALLLSHPRELQAFSDNPLHDALRPVHLAIAASEPGDPIVRAFLQSYLVGFRERPLPNARALMLVARFAKGFGLEAEVRAVADDVAAHALSKGPYSDPAFDAVVSAGVRASIDAVNLEPW
ncbi:hypothetical protein [Polyangium sp. 6x1]|uniref:hypothetical protein n=1 Tax=Polyangium sp. 6x1 TaxID=3042689 RepID=UPI002482EF8E|nr:hypothetical protein [Polyangium sp. 6x1]MDI1451039.1 hypothetical protein [Polyangium sp. 6x1]